MYIYHPNLTMGVHDGPVLRSHHIQYRQMGYWVEEENLKSNEHY